MLILKSISLMCILLFSFNMTYAGPPSLRELLIKKYAQPFQEISFQQIEEIKDTWNEFQVAKRSHQLNGAPFNESAFFEKIRSLNLPDFISELFNPKNSILPDDLQESIIQEAVTPHMIRGSSVSGPNFCLFINSQTWCYQRTSLSWMGNGPVARNGLNQVPSRVISPSLKTLAMNNTDAIAISSENDLWNWGKWGGGDSYTVGMPIGQEMTSPPVLRAVHQLIGSKAAQVSTGLSHSLALLEDGKVHLWGDNGLCQLGVGEGNFPSVQIELPDGKAKFAIAGPYSNYLISEKDEIWTWGFHFASYLPQKQMSYPEKIAHIPGVTQLALGVSVIGSRFATDEFVLALDKKGRVWTWGSQISTTLVPGQPEVSPTLVPNLPPRIQAIFAGGKLALAMDEEGQIWGWGDWKRYFEPTLVDPAAPIPLHSQPELIPELAGALTVEVNSDYATVLMKNGKVIQFKATHPHETGSVTEIVDLGLH